MLILLVNVVLNSLFSSDTIRNFLRELDPESVETRRRRKRLKLKPVGFAVHGAICGLVLR